ncbi:MAG: hypothetical protein QXW97_02920 [Candidatus Pacearchaeota archaeon]
MKKLLNVYKPLGLTPFQLIKEFKSQNQNYKDIPISHAGKLDPLAEGVMLLVAGKEIKNLSKYMKLDKEYIAKILFGFSTDSYDIQGISKKNKKEINITKLKDLISKLKGEYEQTLPVFSGRIVNGKPLFYWARKNKLNQIKIPKEIVKIYDAKLNKIYKINSEDLLNEIKNKINLLNGDFRQKEILDSWEKILKNLKEEYFIAEVLFNVSSGTYIRSIANDIGNRLGSGAVLFNLIRTKVGEFDIKDSIRL